MASCKLAVEDLFAYAFNKLKIENHGFVQSADPSRVERSLRYKLDQFLSAKRSPELEELIHNFSSLYIVSEEELEEVARATFQDGSSVSWGRILAFIGFTFLVAKLAVKSDDQRFAKQCARWLSRLLDTWLSPWIRANGGWSGFVKMIDWEKKVKKVKRVTAVTLFMGVFGVFWFIRELVCGGG